MSKKTKKASSKLLSRQWFRIGVFAGACFVGVAVLAVTVVSVITPKTSSESNMGIGADGFRAYVEEGTSLNVNSIFTKDEVVAALGKKAKSVGEPEMSKVFNLNGDRSQTISYPFVRADGASSTLYLDVKLYKNPQSLQNDHIYVATANAGKISGYPAYYKMAQSIGEDREYHLMIVNGQKAYRFVVAQPGDNITISEVSSLAVLKRLALKSQL